MNGSKKSHISTLHDIHDWVQDGRYMRWSHSVTNATVFSRTTFFTPCHLPLIANLSHPTLLVAISANELRKIPGARRTSWPRKTNTESKSQVLKLNTTVFHGTDRKEKDEGFDIYKDFARWIVHTEHLFISWYAVLDVGLKLDAEDYEDKDEYVWFFHSIHAYHYFQVYEKFFCWSCCLSTTAQGTPSICTWDEKNGTQAKVREGIC